MNIDETEKTLVRVFNILIEGVLSIILVLIVLAIAIGAIQLVISVWELLRFQGITGHYIGLVSDVLTLYVLVELSRSLVDYFDHSRLRISFIVDAAMVFIIREILIASFKHDLQPDMMYAYSALLFVLGSIRVSSVWLQGISEVRHLASDEDGKQRSAAE